MIRMVGGPDSFLFVARLCELAAPAQLTAFISVIRIFCSYSPKRGERKPPRRRKKDPCLYITQGSLIQGYCLSGWPIREPHVNYRPGCQEGALEAPGTSYTLPNLLRSEGNISQVIDLLLAWLNKYSQKATYTPIYVPDSGMSQRS